MVWIVSGSMGFLWGRHLTRLIGMKGSFCTAAPAPALPPALPRGHFSHTWFGPEISHIFWGWRKAFLAQMWPGWLFCSDAATFVSLHTAVGVQIVSATNICKHRCSVSLSLSWIQVLNCQNCNQSQRTQVSRIVPCGCSLGVRLVRKVGKFVG